MTGGSVARSVITHITRLIWYDQVSSTRPGPSLPVAVVPWLIALVTSSDAIRTASEISGSRCHFRSAVVVNSRATPADSGTGGSVMPTCLSVVAASIDVGASPCPSPWRRSLTCVEATCCPWYMDQPPSLMLGASAKVQRMRYDATLSVQMQVQLHTTSITLRSHVPGGAGEVPVQACFDRFGAGTGRLEQVQAVRTSSCRKAGRDARWIWPTGAYGPCSCPAQRGRRAVTAIPAVTAWKWPACLRGRWRYATQSVPVTRSWYSPGPNGRRSLPPSERRTPAYPYPRPLPRLRAGHSPLTWTDTVPGPRRPDGPEPAPAGSGPAWTGPGFCPGIARPLPGRVPAPAWTGSRPHLDGARE